MISNVAVFSEKLYSCGASIAALRSARALSPSIQKIDYIFERLDNLSDVKMLYPSIRFQHVSDRFIKSTLKTGDDHKVSRGDYVKTYLNLLEERDYDFSIVHNFNHPHKALDSIAAKKPCLWMMHDASPVTGMNYAVVDGSRSSVVNYLSAKGIPEPQVFEQLARRPFAFAAPSKWLIDVTKNFVGTDIPFFHVRNSVPANYFFESDKKNARATLGLPTDKFTVLFSAGTGAVVRKNLKLIMDSLEHIPDPDILFVVVGGVPAEDVVEDDRLLYLPSFSPQKQPLLPAQLYSAADVFIIPSLADNLPNTVLESYYCGTPVIGAKAGGIPEMIVENETGWLIDPRDAKSLGELVVRLSENLPEIEKFGSRGKELITSTYSDAASRSDYLKALDYIFARRSRNYLKNAKDANFAHKSEGHPLHIEHSEPFFDIRKPAISRREAIAKSMGWRADSHMAPYRKFWNPSYEDLHQLSFRYRMAALGHPLTTNEERINKWYNAHKGQRAFLIGNGPSLNKCDLTHLRNEITIGVNSIFMKKDELGGLPTHFVVEDNFVAEDRADQINALSGTNKWFGNYLCYCLKGEDVNWLNVRMRYDNYPGFPYFSVDAGRQLWTGGSVTYLCMQLAFYFGIKELYLIGFDHHYEVPKETQIEGLAYTSQVDDPNHFDPTYFGKGYRWHAPMTERMELGYIRAAKVFERFGRKIYNATVGGRLDVLERVEYKDLF